MDFSARDLAVTGEKGIAAAIMQPLETVQAFDLLGCKSLPVKTWWQWEGVARTTQKPQAKNTASTNFSNAS